MSAYLRKLLNESPEHEESKPTIVKKLPIWLKPIQSGRPVTYDTSELYEDRVDESDKKNQSQPQTSGKKCYECDEYGHIAKECPNKWKKKLGGRFKESDWCCPMCGNINWDWRQHCNKCSTPKPTGCTAEKRTGKGGGYNEIDEETRKRLHSKSRKYKSDKNKKPLESDKKTNVSDDKVRDYNDNPTIYISDLPDMDENDLISKIAQLFGQIGRIKRDYHRRKHKYNIRLSDNNRTARLVYEDAHTAPFAIQWFDNTEFEGNIIGVKMKGDVVDDVDEYDDDDVLDDGGEDWNEDREKIQEEEENEMGDIEAELFGFSRRGRGKIRVNKSFRKVKVDKCKDKRTRSRSRSRSRSKSRSRSRSRDRDRHRNRDRRKKYRSSKKSRSYR